MVTGSNVDVLIIGAGPAGVTCANALATAGVHVRIVDKRPTSFRAGHADGIQPRIIEVLHSYGFGERILREGVQVNMAAFYNPSPDGGVQRSEKVPDVTAPTARFPFEMTITQGAIESIFRDSLASVGVYVEQHVKPTLIELSQNEEELKDPNAHPVRVVLEHMGTACDEEREEVVNAKFVLGSDGAHSWVRKVLGIQMEGEQSDHIWGVIDLVPETNFPDIRNKSIMHSHSGTCMIIPREEDRVRLYVQLGDKNVLDPSTGRVSKDGMNPAMIFKIAQQIFKPWTIEPPKEIDWWTIYIIGQRVATKFSANDRIFIAGDACHTHSPKAGQGMNASMNDAHNLAWKLIHVLRGWADMSVLKTYEFERRKFAQDLIEFDRKWSPYFSGKPRTEESQDGVEHDEFVTAFQTFGGFTSGIGIHYAPSTITNDKHQSAASGLIVGQRLIPQAILRCADARIFEIQDLCPSDTRFKVLLFTGDIGDPKQAQKVKDLANDMDKSESFLTKFGGGRINQDGWKAFDVITICVGRKEVTNYTDVPLLFRSHWTKVFLDDLDTTRTHGGKVYSTYRIDPSAGAIIVVRPDGYVGAVAPLSNLADVEEYFSSFMLPA